jgi:SAM-dependent methyltransferase
MKTSKEAGDYLFQIRNNTPEKVGVIEKELEGQTLPRDKTGRIKIVELGTGGGESLRRLKANPETNGDVDLVALDVIPNLVSTLKKEVGVEGVAADAGNLPFADESISAVNASALFHEVSSYGTQGRTSEPGEDIKILKGKEAVIQTLGELNRALLPGGVLAYRDVLAPKQDLKEPKKVKYSRNSWRLFAKWFLVDFNDTEYQAQEEVHLNSDDSHEFILDGPVSVQREFQRHYLMLRDYLRAVAHKEFGITTLRADWVNQTEGLKSVTFTVDEKVISHVDLSSFEAHQSSSGTVYRGDSDRFDELYDGLMEYYFQEVSKHSHDGNNFENVIDGWKEREGSEHYLYGNISDLLEFSVDASDQTQSDYFLMPESTDDVVIAPRFYYDRYLKQVVDNPERDGKQIVTFRKLPRDRALQAIDNLSDSENLDAKSLEKIKLKISKGA